MTKSLNRGRDNNDNDDDNDDDNNDDNDDDDNVSVEVTTFDDLKSISCGFGLNSTKPQVVAFWRKVFQDGAKKTRLSLKSELQSLNLTAGSQNTV